MTTEMKILAIDDLVEECLTILVHGNVIECFVNSCPKAVAVGETHWVEITIDYSNPLQIEESTEINALPQKSEMASAIIYMEHWRERYLDPS